MTWHKINWDDKLTLPPATGKYFCRVIIPSLHGKFDERYLYIHYSIVNGFSCEDVIITHWTDGSFKLEDV